MKNPKIFIISGKARHGKDTVANMINEYYKDQKIINLQYSSYLKEYAKRLTDWDGKDETKPRDFLQHLGTEIIRKQIDPNFFVNRMIDDIKVYSYFMDYITISDARTVEENEKISDAFNNVYKIKVNRPSFDNGLTGNESKHYTEVALNNYNNYDYCIENDGTLEDLNKKIVELMKVIENEY